ncbi:hypothetical protein C3441_15435 [Escherichia coli]|nr:hypothetical protein C3441_15435 [Escherichia coli]
MDMESQKILFALSTPMEIRNECCLPSHSSPKMYLGGSSPIMVGRLRTPYSAYRSGTSLPV